MTRPGGVGRLSASKRKAPGLLEPTGPISGYEGVKMHSVAFGRTGLTGSCLSFGMAYRGPLDKGLTPEAGGDLLARAFDLGVTFWDTSDLDRIEREG